MSLGVPLPPPGAHQGTTTPSSRKQNAPKLSARGQYRTNSGVLLFLLLASGGGNFHLTAQASYPTPPGGLHRQLSDHTITVVPGDHPPPPQAPNAPPTTMPSRPPPPPPPPPLPPQPPLPPLTPTPPQRPLPPLPPSPSPPIQEEPTKGQGEHRARFNGHWSRWASPASALAQCARSAIFICRPSDSGWTPRASAAALDEPRAELHLLRTYATRRDSDRPWPQPRRSCALPLAPTPAPSPCPFPYP